MQSLDIVKLIEKNSMTRLTNEYEHKLLNKIKDSFTNTQQQLFVSSFYCYLHYRSNDFVIDFDDIWKWVGFTRKGHAKRVLEKNFVIDIDYKVEKTASQVGGAVFDTECNTEKSASQLAEALFGTDYKNDLISFLFNKNKMEFLYSRDYLSNYNHDILTLLTTHIGESQRLMLSENYYTTKLYYEQLFNLLVNTTEYTYKDIYFSLGVFIMQYSENQEKIDLHMNIIRSIIEDNILQEQILNNFIVVVSNGQMYISISDRQDVFESQNVEFFIKNEDFEKIPIIRFSSTTETACSICQSDFELNDEIPNFDCGHLFHKDCIYKWFSENGKDSNKCPNCRIELIKHYVKD
jgi:hypothetical protein